MFDHVPLASNMLPPTELPVAFLPSSFSPDQPFALTLPNVNPAAALSGMAQPVVLARFASLADAMQGAVKAADHMEFQAAPQILAILDRDDRLVLAGVAISGTVAWCHPVQSAAEARAVVMEASALRAQVARVSDRQEAELAARLRQRARRLEARLVDPLWRAFAGRTLQIAA
ncbi:DNA repair protein RadC [Gemmobacter fulvus]|uniref:DNA repair protein RadC n=1 Tax=Gemmobacter fulvus TaxID=2840474 RepID=UPI0027969881|nr:DNA repair protein RadC [Gemmobacter fulvus]MDQ1850653.1 DNA repair protein RadC [Gemmobacter fulvus]